jgi:protein phosphatase
VRPRIVVLCGLPGSGKSHWIAQNSLPALSSDEVRKLVSGDENDQSVHPVVFAAMRYLLGKRVKTGVPITYIDATAITIWERRCWVRFAQLHDCEIEAIFFATPLDICQKRNASRKRVVPASVIQKMAKRLVPPRVEEGFARVTVVAHKP